MFNTIDKMNEERDKLVSQFFDRLTAYKAKPHNRRKANLRELAKAADNAPHGYSANPDSLLPLTTDENLKKLVGGDLELEDILVNGFREAPNYMTLRELTHRAA